MSASAGVTNPASQISPSKLGKLLGVDPGPPVGISYALRTAASATVAMAAFRFLGAQGGVWAVVSAMVVIQPETRASVGAAFLRVVANLVGVVVGVSVGYLLGSLPILALAAGSFAVTFFCRLLRLDAAARSACVSMAIVLLKDPSGVLGSSEIRVLGVLTGCGVALLVTVVAHRLELRLVHDANATSASRGVRG